MALGVGRIAALSCPRSSVPSVSGIRHRDAGVARSAATARALSVCLLALLCTHVAGSDSVSRSAVSSSTRVDVAARREQLENALLSAAPYKTDASNAALPWSESYLLQAMSAAYAATHDTRYAVALLDRFDAILADRDDRRIPPRRDELTGRVGPAWGTDRYTQGRWHVWAVHTGMVCLGPAELMNLLGTHPSAAIDGARIHRVLAALEAAVAHHDQEWRWGPRPDEGYYVDQGIGLLPLNQQNALGLVMLELHRATGKRSYRERAAALARFFRNRLRTEPSVAYSWSYQPGIEGNRSGFEDISHAAINVQFAVRCAEAGLVFTRGDLRRFAATYRLAVRRGEGQWSDTVGTTGGTNAHAPQALGRWLPLAKFEPTIIADVEATMPALTGGSSGAMLLGLANLVRYGASRQMPRR